MSDSVDVRPPVEDVLDLVTGFERCASDWHRAAPVRTADDSLAGTITMLHLVNFGLWHCEDRARRTDLPDADVVRSKRAIDRLNASRNQKIEKIDEQVLAIVPAPQPGQAVPEQFETAGMLIDRLSIMALRLYHTSQAGMSERLQVLRTQQRDLAEVLDVLLRDLFAGRRRYRVYRQFKVPTASRHDCGLWHEAHEWASALLPDL